MAVLEAKPLQGPAIGAVLSAAQTGNGDSTNTVDRGSAVFGGSGGALVITSTIGATPTVTVNIQGSVDGTNFFNIPYALQGSPRTFVATAITITRSEEHTSELQ